MAPWVAPAQLTDGLPALAADNQNLPEALQCPCEKPKRVDQCLSCRDMRGAPVLLLPAAELWGGKASTGPTGNPAHVYLSFPFAFQAVLGPAGKLGML